jgi:Lrp/AsnC family transcriptional regulator for asnA, asnC and gidA
MPKLSDIDAVILGSLLRDGRKSYAAIANEWGVTKNKIWKHFRKMEKNGIITGATLQVNFAALGFDALATLLANVEGEQLNQVMDYLGKITEVRAYRQYNSVYNIRAVTTLKNIGDLDHVKEVIRRRIPANGIRTYIWTAVRNMPENLRLIIDQKNAGKLSKPALPITGNDHNIKSKVDGLDLKIIEKLVHDGRTPFSEIADELETSIDTVVKRYKKLERDNIIRVIIQVNPSRIGYGFVLDFNISLKSPSNSQTIELLSRIPDVVIITKTSGDYDLQVTAMIRDAEHMFTIQDEISKLPGVIKIETSARKIPREWPTPMQYISTF